MNERELGKALLHGQMPVDVAELTRRVLRRDRRRVWMLGIVCVVTWMLVVMLPWSTLLPMLAKLGGHIAESNGNASPVDAANARAQSVLLAEIVKKGTLATFFGSIATMFLAALSTVALVMASRHATLRQVNASLVQISDQLKALASRQ